jgi:DNA-binding IclR family transcriptional regulator
VEKIRLDRSATEAEETRLGYTSVAVPVFSSRSTLAGAVSITAPTCRINVGRLLPALRTAGNGIGRALQAMG